MRGLPALPSTTPRAGSAARGVASGAAPAGPSWALLPFCLVAVLVILLFNALRLVAEFFTLPVGVPASVTAVANPSQVRHALPTPSQGAPALIKINLPVQPNNLQFGDLRAPHTLTILTDPACVPCQLQLDAWLRPLQASSVHLVVKYLPFDPANTTAGLLLELARRHNLAAGYWHALTHASAPAGTTVLSDDQLFELLEQQGLALAPLRDELAKSSASLVAALTPDLNAARTANLFAPPVLLLDGTLIDGRNLLPGRLPLYLQRLQAGEPLWQPADAFFAP